MNRLSWLALAVVVAACTGTGDLEGAPSSPTGESALRRWGRGGTKGSGGTVATGGTTTGGSGGAATGTGGTSSASGGAGGTPSSTGGLFGQPEPWTKDVSTLTKDARSNAIIAALKAMGGWGNGNKLQIDFSIPLFFADATTPRATVTAPGGGYCYGGPDCDPVPFQMPLPVNGNMEGSSNYVCDTANNDCHLLVADRSQKKLFELYNATQTTSGLSALVGIIWDLTKAYPPGMRGEQCTSADAAGFPIAGLLPTADEVAAGHVDHALRFILPNARMKAGVYVHPAGHAGGPSSSNADAPPYGVRFRLKASFDETPYNGGQRVILQAMKRYGMLLSDGGNIALTFADDRTTVAKWSSLGITSQSFNSIGVDNFEVVDLSPDIRSTQDCVRNP
ncbi:MAG TPA: hypothetical protein VHU40_00755 [Polyangia bacterium]|nr:hypothetical protein [Polyangia bacterium]